ncbi:MAG: alpha/beta hydrolase [Candidatus Hodarchaeales archaeon]
MIHGFGSNPEVFFHFKDSLGNFFTEEKLNCWALGLSNNVSGNIKLLAHEDVLTAVNFLYEKYKKKVIIVAHSMGGILVRVFTSPHINHPYPLSAIEKMIQGISLLTVPNHGVGKTDITKLQETVNLIKGVLAPDKSPLPSDLGLGFIQLASKSHLLNTINQKPPLNPKLKWLNIVGTYDRVVPRESAIFTDKELEKIPKDNFLQHEFPCDHMTYPLTATLQKLVKSIPGIEKSLRESPFRIYPAIHRYRPVGKLILQHMIGNKS